MFGPVGSSLRAANNPKEGRYFDSASVEGKTMMNMGPQSISVRLITDLSAEN